MTKTLVQTVVLLTCMAGFWISLSTKLQTNSDASGEVAGKLKEQIDAYSREANTVSGIAEQNLKLSSGIDDLAKQVLALTKQNTALLAQIKTVNDNQTKILSQHTQALKDASVAAKRSSVAAENAQANTRKALRAITKPTPKPWWRR